MMTVRPSLLAAAVSIAINSIAPAARAEEEPLALAEVAVSPSAAAPGLEPAAVRSVGEEEVREIDASKLPPNKHYLLSLSVAEATDRPSVAVSVLTLVREQKTGRMLAIVEGRARADGAATPELRRSLLRVAVRSAFGQVPAAISGS